MNEPAKPPPEPVVIKKYANCRLYSPAARGYVTLDQLAVMVCDGTSFVIENAKTGEDITQSVLTQVVFDKESESGPAMLPVSVLRQLIGFYGSSMQELLPFYLNHAMQMFVHNQEAMRDYMEQTFNSLDPFGQFEAMGKRNIALFEETMKAFQSAYSTDDEEPGEAAGNLGNGDDTESVEKPIREPTKNVSD